VPVPVRSDAEPISTAKKMGLAKETPHQIRNVLSEGAELPARSLMPTVPVVMRRVSQEDSYETSTVRNHLPNRTAVKVGIGDLIPGRFPSGSHRCPRIARGDHALIVRLAF
jgi:hypothetical protein